MFRPRSCIDLISCNHLITKIGAILNSSHLISVNLHPFLPVLSGIYTMKGFQPADGLLYAVAKESRSYLVSEDLGATWTDISDDEYAEATAKAGFISATVIPMVTNADLTPGANNPAAAYAFGTWGGQSNFFSVPWPLKFSLYVYWLLNGTWNAVKITWLVMGPTQLITITVTWPMRF